MGNIKWINKTNIYELNVRQFTKEGTFNAIKDHLPRLQQMDVDTIWFMPITPIANIKRKGKLGSPYAPSRYTDVHPDYGTINDFKHLVDEIHKLGMKVIIDWVPNHTGWDHIWTLEHQDFYKVNEEGSFHPTFADWSDTIQLDYSNKALWEAMTDAMKFWVKEADIDGFRVDQAFLIPVAFWEFCIPKLNKKKKLFWLAEADPFDHPELFKNDLFHVGYTWKWMHITKEFYQNKLPLLKLVEVLRAYQITPGIKMWFTSNHDENSWNGTEYEKYGDMAKALAVFSCTWPGIPMIYNGQELPLKERLEFFEKDAIEWESQKELDSFYKTLFYLHRQHHAMQADDVVYTIITSDSEHILSYVRRGDDQQILVVLNLSAEEVHLHVTDTQISGVYQNVFWNVEKDFSINNHLFLKPWDYLVFMKMKEIVVEPIRISADS